jgi:hypothetical protein
MAFYTGIIQKVQFEKLPPDVMGEIKQIYADKIPPIDRARKIASLLVSKDIVPLDDKGVPGPRNPSWPEIARSFQTAKRDPKQWASLRGVINRRVNKNLDNPTLGMSEQDYKQYLPIIMEALKPLSEPESDRA